MSKTTEERNAELPIRLTVEKWLVLAVPIVKLISKVRGSSIGSRPICLSQKDWPEQFENGMNHCAGIDIVWVR